MSAELKAVLASLIEKEGIDGFVEACGGVLSEFGYRVKGTDVLDQGDEAPMTGMLRCLAARVFKFVSQNKTCSWRQCEST